MKKKIITHNAGFHTDDVFAVATLLLCLGDEETEIIRTRDPEIIKTGDYVVDVGMIHDPEKNLFDHHQKEGAGKRDNGIPYASFGLVWQKFGEEICESKEVAEAIDKILVQAVDAGDNGVDITKVLIPNVRLYDLWKVIGIFEPTWKEIKEFNIDDKFLEAVDLAKKVLEREVKKTKDRIEAENIVREVYNNAGDKKLIILGEEYPFNRLMINFTLVNFEEPIYFVHYGASDEAWRVAAVSRNRDTFESRKLLPESWRSLRDTELAEVSGVPDATFCHSSGFMCAAKSKEGAIQLAKKALEA